MVKKTRRGRHEAPKVWHNPDVVGPRRGAATGPRSGARAATEEVARVPSSRDSAPRSGKIVAAATGPQSQHELDRARLLAKLRAAEGRVAITKAADELFAGSFELPADDQEVHLQLLDHSDEARVRAAIEVLSALLEGEPPKRFTVLDSRLRRIEELADETSTREAASSLRRRTKPPSARRVVS